VGGVQYIVSLLLPGEPSYSRSSKRKRKGD
jgi:hypothetical protein